MSQPMHFVPVDEFRQRAKAVVSNADLQKSLRGAMDFLQAKRLAQFPNDAELQQLRDLGESIRQYSLANLPALLTQLEARLTANRVKVHWAESPEDANRIFIEIAQHRGAKSVIKGKSMVSEEVELNHALQDVGIDALESDMGEYIVQLADEKPSHIIMPAIHKTKAQIAELFAQRIPGVHYTDSVDELIQIGRKVLREKFASADIGLSGVNVMVAETGTLCLVENEGNGRMSTTVPRVHVAITGIEKVVEKLSHVPPILSLLTRSATGQAITTYVNMISSPRKPDELDGPDEVHLILLDNGRTQAYADLQLRSTLQCIRCGACMNHCPVYARVGGHTYGTTYPGPIGKIISPHLLGLDSTYGLATASTLCGACAEVCPVRIPIPDLLIRLRTEAYHNPATAGHAVRGAGSAYSSVAMALWHGWAATYRHPKLYRLFTWCATRFRFLTPPRQGGWTENHVAMRPARRRFRDRVRPQVLKK
jgi:L-lactate dehydrogenase complex protein LldF